MPNDSLLPKGRTETALQGVAFGTAVNVVGRLLALARQIVITASFGLAAGLDAFFVGFAFVTMFVFPAGDLFDSVVLPRLVRIHDSGGPRARAMAAATILRAAAAAGAVLVVAIVLAAPVARGLVPGASERVVGELRSQVGLLAPFAFASILYRGLGAVLRAARAFRAYYLGELVVALVSLAALWPWRNRLGAIPLSLGAGFLAGAAVLAWSARGLLASPVGGERVVDWAELRGAIAAALPMYLCVQALLIVDRVFASFLDEGSISALSYGLMLASIVPALLAAESVFLTPLAESDERGELLGRVASGAILLGLPVVAFCWAEAGALVELVLGRGRFDAEAVSRTAGAFRWYVVGVPFLILWPVLIRALQVAGRFGSIVRLGVVSVVLTASLDAAAVFVFEGGVAGLAAATAAVSCVLLPLGLRALRIGGVRVPLAPVGSALLAAGLGAAVATAARLLLGGSGDVSLVGRGLGFGCVYVAAVLLVPNREVTRLRGAIEHSFPRLRRFGRRLERRR